MSLEASIQDSLARLTASERKVATALLADYPFAGLLTVAELSKRARVSGQTILRLTAKLGFQGYSKFQRALIGEIKEGYHSPVLLHENQQESAAGGAFLSGLAESVVKTIRDTAAAIPEEQLTAACDLIGDRRRSVFLLGGRMSDTLASYLSCHLRQIRAKVYKVPTAGEEWPEYLLRMKRNDVAILFDYRRYQPDLVEFAARAARERGAQVVLFTDRWLSPVSRHATIILPAMIDVGTPWDTGASVLFIAEAIINRVSEADWEATRRRIETWDRLRTSSQGTLNAEEDERLREDVT